jgi:hypothetical protein
MFDKNNTSLAGKILNTPIKKLGGKNIKIQNFN